MDIYRTIEEVERDGQMITSRVELKIEQPPIQLTLTYNMSSGLTIQVAPEGVDPKVASFENIAMLVVEQLREGVQPKQISNLYDLDRSIDEVRMSVGLRECLRNTNIQYIGEVVQRSEHNLLSQKTFGRRMFDELRRVLSGMGLRLDMKFAGWVPPNKRAVSPSVPST